MRVFVPIDAASLALGADEVATAIQETAWRRGIPLEIVRNGSRGMFWLEPMIEAETCDGRIAYGPVAASDVAGLFDARFFEGGPHLLRVGKPEDHPFIRRQTRLVFERCGVTDPLCLKDYQAYKGFEGLRRAIEIGPEATIDDIILSGLRGRGGAGFPTGIKWRTVAETPAPQKYIVCNADEGDSGTYADRMVMEGDPYCLIEGMAVAGVAVGATQGYIYIRSEYPHAAKTMSEAIRRARKEGLLGERLLGSKYAFDMEVRIGAGAYVCGEETSLLESIECRRGEVRAKPPLPAHKGLFYQPTVVNNVLSLASLHFIMVEGGKVYRDYGMGRSHGTKPIQLAGNIKHGGLFETAFGITLGDLVDTIGGGTASGRPVRAVQVGGPLGAYFPRELFNTPLDYEAFAAAGGIVGHGGVVVFDDTVDMWEQARFAFEFCAEESCGKCTPCRIGTVRGMEILDKIRAGLNVRANFQLLNELCDTMRTASLCALGGFAPYPVTSAIKYFPEDFESRLPAAAE